MKTRDKAIILGIAGLTAFILLSKKAEGVPQPPAQKYDCSNFDTM